MGSNDLEGHGKETWNLLETVVNRGFNEGKVFEDWLDMQICAYDRNMEDKYLKIIEYYKDERKEGERNIDYFAKAVGAILLETQKAQYDVLGGIFEQCVSHGRNGLFLTPKNLCDLMVALTGVENQGSISDPACGSGRMLISACKKNTNAFFHGRDVTSACAKMTALNMLFFNLNSTIEQGNSLSETIENVWLTQRTAIGGILHQLTKEELAEYKIKRQQILEEQAKVRKASLAVSQAPAIKADEEHELTLPEPQEIEQTTPDQTPSLTEETPFSEEWNDLPLFSFKK